MRFYLPIFFSFFLSIVASAQIQHEVQVDELDIGQLDRLKQYRQYRDEFRSYKQSLQEMINYYRELHRETKKDIRKFRRVDTLTHMVDSLRQLEMIAWDYEIRIDKLTNLKDQYNKDSVMAMAIREKEDINWEQYFDRYLDDYEKQFAGLGVQPDQFSEAMIFGEERTDLKNMMDQNAGQLSNMDGMPDLPEATNLMDLADLSELDIPSQIPESSVEQVTTLVSSAQTYKLNPFRGNLDLLDAGHDELSKLKKKYSSVPDINDLSSAIKRTSLEHEPFPKRLFFGGSNAIRIRTNQERVLWNLELIAGYRINKRWRIGASGSTGIILNGEDRFLELNDKQKLNARIFTQYQFWKQFFGHIEGERAYYQLPEIPGLQYDDNLNAGLGRYFAIPKLKGARGFVLLLYNVDGNTLTRRNVRFRVGLVNR